MASARHAAHAADDRSLGQRLLRGLGEWLIYLLVAALVVTLVRVFLIQSYRVPSGSMEETLQVNDTIVAWKPGGVSRGDIVVFRDDLQWLDEADPEVPFWKEALAAVKLLPPQHEKYLVKRLIGLPGDHVTCCDAQGRVEVNGQALDESDYLYGDGPYASIAFDVVVPAGRIFVMGDHRDNSKDSRFWMCGGRIGSSTPTPDLAFPSLDAVQGKVFSVLLPLNRIRGFGRPETFATVPDPVGKVPVSVDYTCPTIGG
ncbi:MAG: signal peptidase I [Propionibacteriaceae bacterium]|jgi:signal peptidase I|nr:signal peptidase I [Propionibacteriaceae bacterium]